MKGGFQNLLFDRGPDTFNNWPRRSDLCPLLDPVETFVFRLRGRRFTPSPRVSFLRSCHRGLSRGCRGALFLKAARCCQRVPILSPCPEKPVPRTLATPEAAMRRTRHHAGIPQKAEGRPVEDVRDSCAADMKPLLIPIGIGLRNGAKPVPVLERHPAQPGWVGKGLSWNLACDGTSGSPTMQ